MANIKKKTAANIVWFEIPADDVKRAAKFYTSLFGWKIKGIPGMENYWHIDTGGKKDSPGGGLMKRKHAGQPLTNYILVESVAKSAAKVKKLGGKICVPKTAVPGMGHFVVCMDPEKNVFALWQMDPKAK